MPFQNRMMTLIGFLQAQNCSNLPGSWRHPSTMQDFRTPEYYQRIAHTLEEGKIQMAFFADRLALPDLYTGQHAEAVAAGVRAVKMDPSTILMTMGMVTQRLGLGVTYSTTYYEPFHVARLFATMDLMLKGRAAWNIVTSLNRAEAANFGRDEQMGHDARHDRADKFMEVVLGRRRACHDRLAPGAIGARARLGAAGDRSDPNHRDGARSRRPRTNPRGRHARQAYRVRRWRFYARPEHGVEPDRGRVDLCPRPDRHSVARRRHRGALRLWVDLADEEGLEMSARTALSFGFQGKMCIQPKQIAPVNRLFTPGEAEVAFAERVVAAFAEAEAAGSAAIQLDGKFIDYPILYRAQRVLERIATIRVKEEQR